MPALIATKESTRLLIQSVLLQMRTARPAPTAIHLPQQKPYMLALTKTCAPCAWPASIPRVAPNAPTASLGPTALMQRELANLALLVNGVTVALRMIALPAQLANGLNQLVRHLKLLALHVILASMPILWTVTIQRTTASLAIRASTPLRLEQATLHALIALMALGVQAPVNPH